MLKGKKVKKCCETRDEFFELKFKKIEAEIEKLKSNHLFHLTLDNMPNVKMMIEQLYEKNIFLLTEANRMKEKINQIKVVIFLVFLINLILNIWWR